MYNRDVTNPPFGGRFHFVCVSHDSGHKYCARKPDFTLHAYPRLKSRVLRDEEKNKIIREISHEL